MSKAIDSIVRDVNETHGAAVAAASAIALNSGMEVGNEQHISQQVGLLLLHLSDITRTITIESRTGTTSNVMQELTAHFESIGRVLHEGVAVAKLYDREEALNALCNIEIASNALAFLADFKKTNADAHVLACALRGEEPDVKPYI